MNANYIVISRDPFNKPPGTGVVWEPQHGWIKKQAIPNRSSNTPASKPKPKRRRSTKKKTNVVDQITKVAFIVFVVVICFVMVSK